ncbi:MAG TPA: D-alanyl-D-alanine carboxypeptidase family protein [Acidimicrobiia bacterium]|nr:D-alanyl-D-alanine carboxypeptidase family protein [Acidimicrobiia bacterium]
MSRRRSWVLSLLVLVTLVGSAGAFAAPAVAEPTPSHGRTHETTETTAWTPPPPAAEVVFDATTGVVLVAKDPHRTFLPASTQKLMTALTALEHLPSSTTVPISARAARLPNMNIGAKPGQVWKLDDLIHALLMISGNDAAYAIAERSAGTVEAFAAQMNAAGKQLGLVDSTFNDPAGLDGREGVNGGSHVSAYDLAIVARNALAVPEIANTVKLVDYSFVGPDRPHTLHNHNDSFLTTYAGATGMKTGYTTAAQNSLVASATRNGRTLVAVLLGSPGGEIGTAQWARQLLDQAYAIAPATNPTGIVLPPTRVFTADQRQATLTSLPRPLGGATGAARVERTPPTRADTSPTLPRTAVQVDGEQAAATASSGGSSGGLFTLRNALIVLAVLVLAVALLRRRAIVRRRRKIAARQRWIAEARRRGTLDVIETRGGEGRVEVIRPGQQQLRRRSSG